VSNRGLTFPTITRDVSQTGQQEKTGKEYFFTAKT